MKSFLILGILFGLEAAAFPRVLTDVLEKRQVPSTGAAQALSAARTNCGPTPCLVFDATEQYVSTTGEYAYASPAADQIRGPCPGLNAAANHGYLDRSGVQTITQTITGLGAAYGMSADLAGFLAAYAVLIDGDPLSLQWSIGGPPPPTLGSGLFGEPSGISYSHNNYEGDSSITRGDAYINNGDAHSLQIPRFTNTYAIAVDDGTDRYTLDKFAKNFVTKSDQSVAENPLFFAAPFSTTLVSPAAYNFVINMMSNHTAEEPSGYLDGYNFKTFFAVTGDYPNFEWQRGQERIPDNWYRRTSTNQYSIPGVLADLAIEFAAYPDSFKLGGNTNGVNSYAGIDLTDLTGGAFNAADLFQPNNTGNFACFLTQIVQVGLPSAADEGAALAAAVTGIINQYITPITGASGLDCPTIDQYDQTLFNQFPGYKYDPTGQATNY